MSNDFDNDPVGYRAAGGAAVDAGLRTFFRSVYNYMIAGLALTGIVGYGVAFLAGSNPAVFNLLYASPVGLILAFAPLGLSLIFGGRIYSMSPGAAQGVFWLFCVVMGLTMSYIFAAFVGSSATQGLANATGISQAVVLKAFLSAALGFGVLSIFGYTTNRDLSGLGSIAMAGLIAAIIASVAQMVLGGLLGIAMFQGGVFDIIISVVVIAASLGLIAFTTQNLKGLYFHAANQGDQALAQSYAIGGALSLYINFINLFLSLIRLFSARN